MTQQPERDNEAPQLKRALLALREMRQRLEALEYARSEPIAVIGMGCRFPGEANSPAAFWELLVNSVDAISEVPANRWAQDEFYASDFMAPGKANTRWGGFLNGVDAFDPGFFGISPREAMHMDPQQRILLQVAYEALEDAGQAVANLEGSLTGVFVGIHSHSSDYAWMQMRNPTDIDTHTGAGTAHSIVANRLSYLFDWQGPSVALDTACSSSLVAAHLACQSLRNKECNLALAAGVNLFLTPESTITFSKLQMMASDGRCKTFDSRADGFVRSEGCGVVVLKRLSDALADGDRILALVQGSAVNQDGRTNGLTAPNGLSQQNVIRQALAAGQVTPEQISYIETHGTGTKLGDPIEVEALAAVVGSRSISQEPCVLGAVKSNIGHLEAAAGIAGIIKAVLALQNEAIPPQLHLQQLNPLIRLEDTRFVIPTSLRSFARRDDAPRFVGISSFGFGGTNAHVILREAPLPTPTELPAAAAPYLLALSARSDPALRDLAAGFQVRLAQQGTAFADMVYTAAQRRSHLEKRLAVIAVSAPEADEKITAYLKKQDHPDLIQGQVLQAGERGLVFVYSGQGPQWAGMGRELMQTEPIFRAKIEEIDNLLRQYVPWLLVDELTAPPERSRLQETEVAQPAIFAMQAALTALWQAWGIEPEAVVGHSVGEIAAAYAAGVFSLEDAVRVVYHRSRLMQRVTGQGKMAALSLPLAQAEALCSAYSGLAVGAVNSPASTVLSGNAAALEEIVAAQSAQGVFARMLPVNYAFHSPVMETIMPELTRALSGLTPHPARIALYSTVRGARAQAGDYGAAYWAANIRQAVLFGQAIQGMAAAYQNFIEVSPHPVLSENIRQCLGPESTALILPSLRRGQPERTVLLRSLAALYTRGYPLRWEQFTPQARQVDLPHYPWQNNRYWLPNAQPVHAAAPGKADIPQSTQLTEENADWFYELAWIELPPAVPVSSAAQNGSWLILADRQGHGAALADQLRSRSLSVTVSIANARQEIPAWLKSAPNPKAVIDLRAIDARIDDAGVSSTCTPVLETIQLLAAQPGQKPKLWVVTQGVQQISGEIVPVEALAQSPLWGLGRTASLEQPEIWGGLVDLESGPVFIDQSTALASAIIDSAEDQTALRGGQRFAARLARSAAPTGTSQQFSTDGSYLITGGLGALGLQLAQWLVQNGAHHLVLTGRSGLPERAGWQQIEPTSSTGRRIAAVRALEAAGAQVTVAAADSADSDQMAALVAQFGTFLPPLRGVIHAAGLAANASLDQMALADLDAVMNAKARGAWNLHCLTQSLALDFFILFSSNSALFGAAGLGHYAAANHYLDSLARMRRGLGLPALSVNWGWWAGDGIATGAMAEQFRQAGQIAMPAAPALQALGALLASGSVNPVVAAVDWARFKPVYEARRKHPLLALIEVEAAHETAPEESFVRKVQAAPRSARSEMVKTFVRDTVAQVLGFGAADRIDPQQGFASLGMDSVMAVQLRLKLEASLEHPMPSTIAFEYPTLQALAAYLEDEVLNLNTAPAMPESAAPAPSETTNADDLLARLDAELAAINKLSEGE